MMTNVVICGIGGQGNILASGLMGSALVEMGYKVAVGETYGASQRGGSVMSHLRVSDDVERGVLIPEGKADVVVAFEPVEALRILRVYGNPERRSSTIRVRHIRWACSSAKMSIRRRKISMRRSKRAAA